MKHILRECTPPVLWKLASALRGSSPDTTKGVRRQRQSVVVDIDPTLLEYVTGAAVMAIATERVRYSGGLSYTCEQHHFMQYYVEGRGALSRFYERHQPTDIFERHFLPASGNGTAPKDGYPWTWYLRPRLSAAQGEQGLGPEHGRQHYGPVSREKVDLEARRLDELRQSIRANGFDSRLGGYLRGYFLLDAGGDWVFHVKGGQHRVAALAHLGHDRIQACFHRDHPRVIAVADVDRWPMVRLGQLTRDEALLIFQAYFRPAHLRFWS